MRFTEDWLRQSAHDLFGAWEGDFDINNSDDIEEFFKSGYEVTLDDDERATVLAELIIILS